jgi:flagellar motor protein MotB
MAMIPRYCSWLCCLCSLWLSALGCNRSPYPNAPYAGLPPANALGQLGPQIAGVGPLLQPSAQLLQMQQQLRQYEEMNRTLTTQLAQAQQQAQLANDKSNLFQRQLQDYTAQVQQLATTNRQLESQSQSMQASINKRGGAKLTANNSVPTSTSSFRVPGVTVIQEGGLIRMRIPSDQLFVQGSAQIVPSGSSVLDQVATAISASYPRQRIGIEGHTDDGPLYGGIYNSPFQLAGAQSQAVMEQLVKRNNLSPQQLFTIAHGPNHPLGNNQSAAGRADNRRIEIVVYPETF